MAINFNNALGIHEQAMQLRIQRSEVLANNLANADTPNYKARDIDFKAALNNEIQSQSSSMKRTSQLHMNTAGTLNGVSLKYRTPLQPSVDGNTVDSQAEMSRFAKNSMDFQASFQFLNNKFKGLSKAISGGQ